MASPPPTRSRRAARRSAIGHELLAAFERLIAEGETFASMSVDRLTTEAGISRSTFYVYFEDKNDLLSALAEEIIQGLIAAAEEWWTLTDDITRPRIDEALGGIVDHYVAHQAVMLAVAEAAATDLVARAQYSVLLAQTRDQFEAHILTGQRTGSISTEVDAHHAAGWLTWMTERGLGRLVAPASGESRERLVRALTDVVWNTLYRDVA
jgi:AcrR family transcriptional regulator